MTDFRSIATCFEVTDEIVEAALRPASDMNDDSPRARVFSLLEHMAGIARPKAGAPRILRVLARMAACDWIDGELDVRVVAHGAATAIELYVNDGLSVSKMREAFELAVPYEELRKAIASKPELVRPLVVNGQVGTTKTRLVARGLAGASVPPLSAADVELFSASPMPAPRSPTRRPARSAPSVPPARRPQPTLVGYAEPPAVLGKVALMKRAVPAPRSRDSSRAPVAPSERGGPKSAGTTKSSGKRAPKSPRRP